MVTPELRQYVVSEQARGIPDVDIKKSLKDAGWDPEDIEDVFRAPQAEPMLLKLEKLEAPREKEKRNTLPFIAIGCLVLLGIGLFVWARFLPTSEEFLSESKLTLLVEGGYENQEAGFRIRYPLGWDIDDRSIEGYVVFYPLNENVRKLVPIIGIKSILQEGEDAARFIANEIQTTKNQIDYVAVADKEVIIRGTKGRLLEGIFSTPQGSARKYGVFLEHGFRGYVITAVAPEALWGEYRELFESVVSTFEIIPTR